MIHLLKSPSHIKNMCGIPFVRGDIQTYERPHSEKDWKEARYDWMHSIPARLEDKFQDEIIPRTRRVSLTFRTVIIK